jgi:hypothetical protein
VHIRRNIIPTGNEQLQWSQPAGPIPLILEYLRVDADALY